MNSSRLPPRISFVVPTDSFATIAKVVERLAAQKIAAEIELVVICPAASALGRADVDPLAFLIVEHGLVPLGEARAAGVRAATAPVVAIGETHAFPEPDWAERILQAHDDGPWAVVVPSIANANPDGGARSWSSFLIDYGEWAATRQAGEVGATPAYNVTYKREVLLSFGSHLSELLEPGSAFPQELAARGHRSYFEPQARIEHLNLARARAWLAERFLSGRLLGARRRARWPFVRTLAYITGSPLIPVVRLLRTRNALAVAHHAGRLPPHTALAVIAACIVWGAGELVGYVAGRGRAETRLLEYELHKARYT